MMDDALDIPLEDHIANGEAMLACMLGAAAEHRRLAEEIERQCREMALKIEELRVAQAHANGVLQ